MINEQSDRERQSERDRMRASERFWTSSIGLVCTGASGFWPTSARTVEKKKRARKANNKATIFWQRSNLTPVWPLGGHISGCLLIYPPPSLSRLFSLHLSSLHVLISLWPPWAQGWRPNKGAMNDKRKKIFTHFIINYDFWCLLY